MKMYLFFICLASFVVNQTVFAQAGYLIKGDIAGLPKPHSYAYLVLYKNGKALRDSVEVVNGKFTFKGRVVEPNIYFIFVKDAPGVPTPIHLVVDNTTITIKGKADELWKSKVTGSPLTDELIPYLIKYSLPARDSLIANSKTANELLAKGDTLKAMEYYRLNQSIMGKQLEVAEQYIREHPQSFLSLHLLNGAWQQFDEENTRKYLAALPSQWRNHSLAKDILKTLEEETIVYESTQIGKQASEFSQPDTNNTLVSLNSFRGKYVLIDFWASWCGPCRTENPNLVKTYEKYKSYGFEILGVSLDENKEKWQKAIYKDKLTWMQVSDLKGWQNQAAVMYGVMAIPNNALIDPQGKIIAKNLRGEKLDKYLQDVFLKR